jgi:hypothetical protein
VPFVRANAALTISDVEITRMTNLLCFLVLPYDPLLWIGELQAEQLCEPVSSVMIQRCEWVAPAPNQPVAAQRSPAPKSGIVSSAVSATSTRNRPCLNGSLE